MHGVCTHLLLRKFCRKSKKNLEDQIKFKVIIVKICPSWLFAADVCSKAHF